MAGSVQVFGWDRPLVSVVGTMGDGTQQVSLSGDDYRTSIEVVLEEGIVRPGPTHLEVYVPEGSRVEAGTVLADVTVSDVTGAVYLNTVSGRARVSGRPREVEVKSLKGDVELSVAATRMKVNSAAGKTTLGSVVYLLARMISTIPATG